MISVVIPLYNKEQSIAATLQSVVNQTYADWELIIINDGSTDKSLDVVKGFVKHIDNRLIADKISIISQENAGVSAARNRGIMEAKGEYVAFLDADDLWASNYLEVLAQLIKDFPDEGLYSLGYTEISENEIKRSTNESLFRGRVAHPWMTKKGVWTGCVAATRERLVKLGMFDTRMTHGEDLDMWWRLILDGGLAIDETCCAYYRIDAENRAMSNVIPLEKHIPYYIDKFEEARANNLEFRRYFDKQMIYRLYPYLFDKQYKSEAKRIAKEFDYSLQKSSMRWRMEWPLLYRIYQKITGK